MPLLLTKNEVFNYWLEKSPELLLAMRLWEKKEVWVDTREENLVALSEVLSSMSVNDLSDNEENIISLSLGLSFSQSMMLFSYLESVSPGLLTHLLMLAKEKTQTSSDFKNFLLISKDKKETMWPPGELLIERLQLLKDADYFDEVFSSSKWVKNLLSNNAPVSEIKEVQLLNFSCHYPKTQIDNAISLKKEIENLSGLKTIKSLIETLKDCVEEASENNALASSQCVVLSEQEVCFLVDKGSQIKEFEEFEEFLEIKDELISPIDSSVFPEASRLAQLEEIYVFFNLPVRYITLMPDKHEMQALDFRIRILEKMNEDVLSIKAKIKEQNIENIPAVIKELIMFNDFRNHVTQEGVQGVIDAFKQVDEKEKKEASPDVAVNEEEEEEEEQEEQEEQEEDLFDTNTFFSLNSAGDTLEETNTDKIDEKDNTDEIDYQPEEEIAQEIPEPTHIDAELFSSYDAEEFKSEQQDTKSDLVEAFITKKLKKSAIRKKLLAKSDNLFSGIEALYKNFPHFGEVIEYLDDYCHLQKSGDGVFYVPPTLLVGGAGVGKTFFAHELSKLVSTHFEVFDMASMTAAWVLVGSSSSWRDASPGKIFNSLIYKETMNPIFVLDEIDKCMTGNYPPENTLLPLLEQFTAKSFKDECIPLKIDASNIVWFATANSDKTISAPLKSRFHIINVPEPDALQKRALIANIYRRILDGNSWGHNFDKTLPTSSIDYLCNQMTSGARDLRKVITIACAKAIRHDRKEIIPEDFYKMKTTRSIGF